VNCPTSWIFTPWWMTLAQTLRLPLANRLGLRVFQHDRNYGYGRNQQACYREAPAGAEVVIMLHPDYQYTPQLVTTMASMAAYGIYDVVLGSRIIGGTAVSGGMPIYQYVANRLLAAFENIFFGVRLSEYHTGYRAFSRQVLTQLPLLDNFDAFVFDNQMLARSSTSDSVSVKFPVLRNIWKKLHPSIFVAAWSTDWAYWRPLFSICCQGSYPAPFPLSDAGCKLHFCRSYYAHVPSHHAWRDCGSTFSIAYSLLGHVAIFREQLAFSQAAPRGASLDCQQWMAVAIPVGSVSIKPLCV
jgi:hypothetical protein